MNLLKNVQHYIYILKSSDSFISKKIFIQKDKLSLLLFDKKV